MQPQCPHGTTIGLCEACDAVRDNELVKTLFDDGVDWAIIECMVCGSSELIEYNQPRLCSICTNE